MGKQPYEYVDEIKKLKREKKYDQAIELLIHCVRLTEKADDKSKHGVAPWYYEQLAIIYRKLGMRDKEIGILERYMGRRHAPGALPEKLKNRLKKLRSS